MRRWWSRTRGIRPESYETWRASVAEVPGRPPRVLAWAATADGSPDGGLVVLSPSVLSVVTSGGSQHDGSQHDGSQHDGRQHDGWQHVGWHEIERGGWNQETRQLRWHTYAGRHGAVDLPDPDGVPAVFKERVAASIVFERFVPVAEGSDRGVVVSGRRDLSDSGSSITWHTTLTRGITWRTPGVQELADRALADVRFEYDEG